MKKNAIALILILIMVILTGCADVAQIQITTTSEPYGFISGIWHGIIIPFSLFGGMFSNDIAIYGINNTGWWYDLGFFIGTSSSITVRLSIK